MNDMEQSELLTPRYKVIADYPHSPYPVGTIGLSDSKAWIKSSLRLLPMDADKYPAIFQPLQWWEERKAEDLPEYVTDDIQSEVAQVERFVFGKYPYVIIKAVPPRDYCHWSLPHVLPATKEEYDTYNTTQTTQQ